MPRISKDEVTLAIDSPVVEGRYHDVDGFTVGFERFHADADGTPLFLGLPDDRCQCPHWGVVLSGALTLRFADRDETYVAGDAYIAGPGHVPIVTAGTELVEFSPAEAHAETMAVLEANMREAVQP